MSVGWVERSETQRFVAANATQVVGLRPPKRPSTQPTITLRGPLAQPVGWVERSETQRFSIKHTRAASAPSDNLFKHPAPDGHAKTVSAVLGEIVWLMSQSPLHKQFFISDLEWFVMTPILRQQFRLFYAKNKPIGVVLWAFVDEEVARRLAAGASKLRPQDWKCGEQLWVVEAIAPFGGPEAMIQNLKKQVFADKELRYLTMSAGGEKEVKVL